MRLMTSMTDEDFVRGIHATTGLVIKMATPSDTLTSMHLRTMPMEHSKAVGLSDYMSSFIEPGDNIPEVKISVMSDNSISIKCDDIAGPIGNLERFITGTKPGLTISDIVAMSGLPYEKTGSDSDAEKSIMITLPGQLSEGRKSGIGAHVDRAIMSYIQYLDHSQQRKLDCRASHNGLEIYYPNSNHKNMLVDGMIRTLYENLHRDRAIPLPYGNKYYSQGVILLGRDFLNRNRSDSIEEMNITGLPRNPDLALKQEIEEMKKIGIAPDMLKSCAMVSLADGYVQHLKERYRDIPDNTFDIACEKNLLASTQDIVIKAMDNWKDRQPSINNERPQEPRSPSPGM